MPREWRASSRRLEWLKCWKYTVGGLGRNWSVVTADRGMKHASWLSFQRKEKSWRYSYYQFRIPHLSWMLNNLAQSISSKLTWLQKKELIEDGDDNAVSGRHTPAIPAAEHHSCQPQCTKLNTSKAILLKSREREVSDLYLAVARPTSSTICHPDPQQPLASHLSNLSPPSPRQQKTSPLLQYLTFPLCYGLREKTAPRVLVEFLLCCYVRHAHTMAATVSGSLHSTAERNTCLLSTV